MSHPLKDYARGVQDELARDKDLVAPKYQWCLRQVEELYGYATSLAALDGGRSVVGHREFKAAVIVQLVKVVRQRAHKAQRPTRTVGQAIAGCYHNHNEICDKCRPYVRTER